ncbi:MAG: hypothetical protein PGN11_00920 [Quadrisphaera sp.]
MMGLSVGIYDEDSPPRKTKTRLKPTAVQVDVLEAELEDVLERFYLHDPARLSMPMFSRWSPIGRDWRLTAPELEDLAAELRRVLPSAEPGSDTARMLQKLLAMAERALAEGLVMCVSPD